MLYLMGYIFLASPVAAVVAFGVFLSHYAAVRKLRKTQPEQVDMQAYQRHKRTMILAGIVAGVFLALVLGVVGLFFAAIAFM